MHIPDGFVDVPTSLGAAGVAAGGVGVALRRTTRSLGESVVPLAGLAAAFIFVVQMLNFPVAAGTSGHLLGGALAAILLGPSVGVIVVAVVVATQGLVFADGGLSAIGLNVVNMAIVTALVGWLVFRGATALLPRRGTSIVAATALASWASVIAASMAFTAEYAIGGQGAIPAASVFRAMVGVHALIGIGEGIISGLVVSAVLASRPDLVRGASAFGVVGPQRVRLGRRAVAAFVASGLAVAAFLVVVVAPHAASAPDGLERVALDQGFGDAAVGSAAEGSPLADYEVAGLEDGALSTILAGIAGLVLTFSAGAAAMRIRAGRRTSEEVKA
jgi:cobalt/nickel transport system permease protein